MAPSTRRRSRAAASAAASASASAPGAAWRCEAGSIGNLRLEPTGPPPAEPSGADVVVAVRAVGLNFADVFTAMGLYGATPEGTFVPGLECSGVVSAAGPEATHAVGDRVMCVSRFGAYATAVTLPSHQAVPLPEAWSFAEGAAFLVQALTVYYGMKELGNLKRGKRVLVQSAAGGCGLAALAICKAVGATAVGVVGSERKVSVVKERFPEHPSEDILVRSASPKQFGLDVQAAAGGEGYDIVLDAVAGDYFQGAWDAMARGGRYVVYGAADMTPQGDRPNWLVLAWRWLRRPRVEVLDLPGGNKSLMGFNLIWMFDKVDELSVLLEELLALDLPAPLVGHTFAWEELPEALRLFRTGTTVGKVVVELPPEH